MTGAASGLGAAVTARLVANPEVGKVVGLDDHRGQTEGVTWRVLDIRERREQSLPETVPGLTACLDGQ